MMDLTDKSFVMQTMLTCIGNKRKLVKNITDIINSIDFNKEKINIVDGFAGSSVVSRELSYFADNIYINDLEFYSYIMAYGFLKKPNECDIPKIKYHIDTMNKLAENGPFIEGIICEYYSPKDTYDIKQGERCFYTKENALIIDTLRDYIEKNVDENIKNYCLTPLLTRASIHTNTSGVFKGFYKNGDVGCFGGKAKVALSRILKPIRLDMPIWNDTEYKAHVYNLDINKLIHELPNDIDLIYLDPPYNQHPYGSNYFMLNIIAKNEKPLGVSKVSGIPTDWNKSKYNSKSTAIAAMKDLVDNCIKKSNYVLISYNNEGIIKDEDWKDIFKDYTFQKKEIKYDTFKGCRNLKDRDNKVLEVLYLVYKKI